MLKMTSYFLGFDVRKSKKKTLSDYNFYLKEASSTDSVDTESLLSSDCKLDDVNGSDPDILEDDHVTSTKMSVSNDDLLFCPRKTTLPKNENEYVYVNDSQDFHLVSFNESDGAIYDSIRDSDYITIKSGREFHNKNESRDFPDKIEQMNHEDTEKDLSHGNKANSFQQQSFHNQQGRQVEEEDGAKDKETMRRLLKPEDLFKNPNKSQDIKYSRKEEYTIKEHETSHKRNDRERQIKENNERVEIKKEQDLSMDAEQVIQTTTNSELQVQNEHSSLHDPTKEAGEIETDNEPKLISTNSTQEILKSTIISHRSLYNFDLYSEHRTQQQQQKEEIKPAVATSSSNEIHNRFDAINYCTKEKQLSNQKKDLDQITHHVGDSIDEIKIDQDNKGQQYEKSIILGNQTRENKTQQGTSNIIISSKERNEYIDPIPPLICPIRADQFNKVCPVPVDEVQGFRRGNLTKTQLLKRHRELFLVTAPPLITKLKKSTSMSTPKLLRSPAVGRDKWIQFEEKVNVDNIIVDSTKEMNENNRLVSDQNYWMSFESHENNVNKVKKHDVNVYLGKTNNNNDMCISTGIGETLLNSVERLHEECPLLINKDNETSDDQPKTEQVLRKEKPPMSEENLLNKTITLLRRSGAEENQDEKMNLVCNHEDELSDELVSIEFDTDEEKLREKPAKQFPDVSLFQAQISVKDKESSNANGAEQTESTEKVDKAVLSENESLHQYPPPISQNTWNFFYRYPERKRKWNRRRWLPVSVDIDGDLIKINGSSKHIPELIKEIPLHPFFVFTVPAIHKGNKDGKVHSVKLQYVKYKEKRRLKAKFGVEHIPTYTPVMKLSSRDVLGLKDFISEVESKIRNITTYRDKGITYSHEEIFIDSEDQCQFLVSGDGNLLKYNVTVQLRLRVFVTGTPELKLFLNDVNNKKILSKAKETLTHDDRKLLNHWISPERYEYHPCVDANKSKKDGGIVFVPPDGCSFELLRFRVRKLNPLPLIATSSLEVLAANSVHLKSSIRVNGDDKRIRHKRNDVILYIPVPFTWSKLFYKYKNFSKNKSFVTTKTKNNTPRPSKKTNQRVKLRASIGSATYEPAYSSIVWKVGTLPIIRDGIPVDIQHTFECMIELPFPLKIRDNFQPYSYLEYSVPYQMASDVSVEEVLLSDGRLPEKWVCYRSSYMHKIEMKIVEDGKERKCPP